MKNLMLSLAILSSLPSIAAVRLHIDVDITRSAQDRVHYRRHIQQEIEIEQAEEFCYRQDNIIVQGMVQDVHKDGCTIQCDIYEYDPEDELPRLIASPELVTAWNKTAIVTIATDTKEDTDQYTLSVTITPSYITPSHQE